MGRHIRIHSTITATATLLLLIFLVSSFASPVQAQSNMKLRSVGHTDYSTDGVALPGANTEIVIQDGFAFVGSYGNTMEGLKIVDISDPTNPVLIAEVKMPEVNAMDVKVQGDWDSAFRDIVTVTTQSGKFTDESWIQGVTLLDISDPHMPVVLSTIDKYDGFGGSHNHYFFGDHLFVGGIRSQFGLFDVWDVSDPTSPTFVIQVEVPAGFGDPALEDTWRTHDLFVQRNNGRDLLYAVGRFGLNIFDVSDPTDPVMVAYTDYKSNPEVAADIPKDVRLAGGPHYVEPTPDGRWVFVGHESCSAIPGGIHTFKQGDMPSADEVRSGAAQPILLEHVGFFLPPQAQGGKDNQGSVESNPSKVRNDNAPPPTDNHHGNRHLCAWTMHNFDVHEDFIVVGGYFLGVLLLDSSDPANLKLIAHKKTVGGSIGKENSQGTSGPAFLVQYPMVWQAVSDGRFVYASDIVTGLYVLEMVEVGK